MNRLEQLVENHLPDAERYFGKDYDPFPDYSTWQKLNYWIHNFPGIHFQIKDLKISMLEFFEGHPGDRIYFNTPSHHIVFAPISKIQKYDKTRKIYLDRFSWLSIRPQMTRDED